MFTFDQRAEQLLIENRLPGGHPSVTAAEIEHLRATHPDDATRLTALDALTAPRLEYERRQAGGRPDPKFTQAQIAEARAFFAAARAHVLPGQIEMSIPTG